MVFQILVGKSIRNPKLKNVQIRISGQLHFAQDLLGSIQMR
jgi:hypothetical protein